MMTPCDSAWAAIFRGNRGQHPLEGIQVIKGEYHGGVIASIHGHQVSDVRGTRQGRGAFGLALLPPPDILDGVGDNDSRHVLFLPEAGLGLQFRRSP